MRRIWAYEQWRVRYLSQTGTGISGHFCFVRILWVMPVQCYFLALGRTAHHYRDKALKRRRGGYEHMAFRMKDKDTSLWLSKCREEEDMSLWAMTCKVSVTNRKWYLRSLLVCTVALGHAGSMLFYGFGPYGPQFSRYCSKKMQVRVAIQTESSIEIISGLYRFLESYWFIVILWLWVVWPTIPEI